MTLTVSGEWSKSKIENSRNTFPGFRSWRVSFCFSFFLRLAHERKRSQGFLPSPIFPIVLDSLCTSIGSIVFKCEGKDTNLFSNIQIFNAEK